MKKLIMFTIIFCMSLAIMPKEANAEFCLVGRSVTKDPVTNTAKAGSIEKCWEIVRNESGGDVSDGEIVVMDSSNANGYSVTTSIVAGEFGKCMIDKESASACADDEFCRCQTYGYTNKLRFDPDQNNAVVRKPLFLSESQAGYVNSITSPAATDQPLGYALEAASATGDIKAILLLR